MMIRVTVRMGVMSQVRRIGGGNAVEVMLIMLCRDRSVSEQFILLSERRPYWRDYTQFTG